MENELTELYDLFDEFILINEQSATSAPNRVKETENLIKINFKGSNKNGWLFIYYNPIMAQDAEMMGKLIGQALKLKREEMAEVFINENQHTDIKEIKNQLQAQKIVIWGNNLQQSNPPYQVEKMDNTMTLFVDDVSAFRDNKSLKTKLWEHLQLII